MKSRSLILSGAAALCTPFLATAAHAQDAPQTGRTEATDESLAAPDIIVTAQKRSERLLDVPLSITAATGEQLTNLGVTSSEQLTKVVPGFTYQKSTYGTPVFQIRGVGFYDTSVGASPTVSVYVDQVPLPFSTMTRGAVLDLERVEVLKGPQGTLFGQNSTGGAINFIAARPTSTPAMGFALEYGRFDEVNIQAFVSGPITDTLRMRVAGRYEYRGPWQRGYAVNDQKFGKSGNEELGDRRFANGRVLLDWLPSEDVRFELSVSGWQDQSDTQAAQFQMFSPDKPRDPFNGAVYEAFAGARPLQPIPRDARLAGWDNRYDLARDDYLYQIALKGEVDLSDSVRVTSISAYTRFHEESTTDIDGVAFNTFVNQRVADIKSFSQELRLSGEIDRFKWMVGGNYASDIPREIQTNLIQGTNSYIGPFHFDSVQVRSYQSVKTYSGFGSVDVALTDQLTLQGALRYTKQDRLFRGCFADAGNGQFALAFGTVFGASTQTRAGACVTLAALPPAPPVVLPFVPGTLNEDNWSWRGGLSWKPDRDTLLYANVTKGYKAGSFPAIPGGFAFQYSSVTQESILAYEAGFKRSWLGGAINVSGAGFYYDYRNKQLLGVVPVAPLGFFPRLVNIPKSRVVGAELNISVVPVQGLTLSAGGTYVDSKVRANPAAPINAYGAATSYIGASFPNAPRWQGVGDAEYRFDVGGGRKVSFGASVTARTEADAVFNGTTAPAVNQPPLILNGYALLDLRAGIEDADGRWRAQIWGRNVTNAYYLLNKFRPADTVASLAGMPATYGVSLSYRY